MFCYVGMLHTTRNIIVRFYVYSYKWIYDLVIKPGAYAPNEHTKSGVVIGRNGLYVIICQNVGLINLKDLSLEIFTTNTIP